MVLVNVVLEVGELAVVVEEELDELVVVVVVVVVVVLTSRVPLRNKRRAIRLLDLTMVTEENKVVPSYQLKINVFSHKLYELSVLNSHLSSVPDTELRVLLQFNIPLM